MNYLTLFFKKLLRFLLKPLSFLPAFLMMYLIFSFSSQTGTESGSLSFTVSQKIVSITSELLDQALTEEVKLSYVNKIHPYVRKLAHVTEYFLLAVSVSFPLYVYRLRGIPLVLIAGAFCVGFACLDELHQSFILGRTPSKRDVMIDSIGIFSGIILVRITGFIGRKTIFRPLSLSENKKRNAQRKR